MGYDEINQSQVEKIEEDLSQEDQLIHPDKYLNIYDEIPISPFTTDNDNSSDLTIIKPKRIPDLKSPKFKKVLPVFLLRQKYLKEKRDRKRKRKEEKIKQKENNESK